MFEKLNRQEVSRIIALGLVWSCIFAGFYFLFWQPKVAEIKRKQRTLNLKKMERKRLKRNVENWPETFTREKLVEKKAELERLLNAVPEEEEIPDLLSKVQQYATNNAGLKFLSLIKDEAATEDSDTKKSKYKQTVYRLSVNGDFFGILDFLHQLETSQRLIIVDELRLQNVQGEVGGLRSKPLSEANSVNAVMTFSVFYSGAAEEKNSEN